MVSKPDSSPLVARSVIVTANCWGQLTPCMLMKLVPGHGVVTAHVLVAPVVPHVHVHAYQQSAHLHSFSEVRNALCVHCGNREHDTTAWIGCSGFVGHVCRPLGSRRVLWFIGIGPHNSAVVPSGYSHCWACHSCKRCRCHVNHVWSSRRNSIYETFHGISNHEWCTAYHVPANPAVYTF